MLEEGNHATYEEVLHNIQERDRIDSTREESPLRKADDAIEISNDDRPIDEQLDLLLKIFREKVEDRNR